DPTCEFRQTVATVVPGSVTRRVNRPGDEMPHDRLGEPTSVRALVAETHGFLRTAAKAIRVLERGGKGFVGEASCREALAKLKMTRKDHQRTAAIVCGTWRVARLKDE